MKNKLIADSGSTKTDWALLQGETDELTLYTGKGINPLQENDNSISQTLREVRNNLTKDIQIDELYFYGAGCATKSIKEHLKNLLLNVFPGAEISVESDMTGAAKSLFGNESGIACILGTGSNSCVYDGKHIIDQIPSLGFILGDEGSGNALGRALISKVLKKQLPEKVTTIFYEETGSSLEEILLRVYKSPLPSAYLASFAPFLLNHLEYPELRDLAMDEFKRFFRMNIIPYSSYNLKIGIVGSIAYNFKELIDKAAKHYNLEIIKIEKSPISGLIEHHRKS